MSEPQRNSFPPPQKGREFHHRSLRQVDATGTVLVVEDETRGRQLLREISKRMGTGWSKQLGEMRHYD